jgi:hypothetical protein
VAVATDRSDRSPSRHERRHDVDVRFNNMAVTTDGEACSARHTGGTTHAN